MTETSTLDKKMSFTLKDMIYLGIILVSMIGTYYSTDIRIVLIEIKMDSIETQVNKNAKLTRAIYLGLVANGDIKPDPSL